MIFKKLISLSVTSLVFSAIRSLAIILLLNQHAIGADLMVKVSDVEKGKGHLMIALYESEETYKSDKASFAQKVEALNSQEIVIFENLPDGEYAIKMYQDENDNNNMDFIMGIPQEGYGFSNNVGMFGVPKYTEVKFSVKESTAIEIDLF